MARETCVQSQVESYQRLKKWYSMPPCLTLSIIRYGSMVKWCNPGKGVAPSPTPWCCSYRKGSLRVTLDYGRQLYFTICYQVFYLLQIFCTQLNGFTFSNLVNSYVILKFQLIIKRINLNLNETLTCTGFKYSLLYGCTTWTLTKRLEKKLVGNYTRILRAILNKSWRQHPTRHQLYGYLPPITKTIQVRRARHAGHCWRSRDEFISDVFLRTPTFGQAKAGRPARTYIQQLCEDTGGGPEDLAEAMNDREKCQERVRDIRACGTTWWWWWWYGFK